MQQPSLTRISIPNNNLNLHRLYPPAENTEHYFLPYLCIANSEEIKAEGYGAKCYQNAEDDDDEWCEITLGESRYLS